MMEFVLLLDQPRVSGDYVSSMSDGVAVVKRGFLYCRGLSIVACIIHKGYSTVFICGGH